MDNCDGPVNLFTYAKTQDFSYWFTKTTRRILRKYLE